MRKNIILFYILNFLQTFVFTTAIWSFFFSQYLHFSFGEGLFIITLTGVICSIFEIPSGAWADRFGRKKIFILGIICNIFSLLIWIFASQFYIFLIASLFAGFGLAICSGNLESIIHDELQSEKKEDLFSSITANSYSFLFIGRACASFSAGYLFSFHPLLPVYATLFFTSIMLFLSFFLSDSNQKLSHHDNNLCHLKESLFLLTENKVLWSFILILGGFSGVGHIYYYTQQPYFHQIGLPIEYVSITFSIGALFSALGSYIYKKTYHILKLDLINRRCIIQISYIIRKMTSFGLISII